MPPGAPPTESHPVPTQRRPQPSHLPPAPRSPRHAPLRNADRGRPAHRARIRRLTGFIGALLALVAVIIFIVVATALHTTEHSVSGLINRINHEINEVKPANH
jgi:hypothetical protein